MLIYFKETVFVSDATKIQDKQSNIFPTYEKYNLIREMDKTW